MLCFAFILQCIIFVASCCLFSCRVDGIGCVRHCVLVGSVRGQRRGVWSDAFLEKCLVSNNPGNDKC